MKIDGTQGPHSIPDSEQNKSRTETPDRGFEDIFKQALHTNEPQSVAPPTTAFVRPTIPVAEIDPQAGDRDKAIEKMDQLLDLLEDYRRQLLQPGDHAKELDKVVQRLDARRASLGSVLDGLPDDDALKGLLNQSLVTAAVESFKFHRGDYLAA